MITMVKVCSVCVYQGFVDNWGQMPYTNIDVDSVIRFGKIFILLVKFRQLWN